MKIKQSYLGDQSAEGYLYEWFPSEGEAKQLEVFPHGVKLGSVLELDGSFYRVKRMYDCSVSPEELEVVWFEVAPYVFQADFVLQTKQNAS